jgi:hypothetical protein
MEVHQHAHTPRKKWTHYFWEFFMLFLAVFCGFLAEYALEHKIETNREKQYVRSMVEDLKLDTAALNRIIELRTKRIEMLDSFSLLLNETGKSTNLSDLYYYSIRITRIANLQFIYNDRTIQQLKNSGSLRLIRSNAVSDSIILYESRVRRLENSQEREEANIRDSKPYRVKIFDGRIYDEMLTINDQIRRPGGSPALLQYKKEDLEAFNGYLHYVKGSNIGCRSFSMALYHNAVNVINTIKKEYHLK